ncbi:hypothetical protein E4U14_007359, partial [Claviceps sp. LM454 group G7]
GRLEVCTGVVNGSTERMANPNLHLVDGPWFRWGDDRPPKTLYTGLYTLHARSERKLKGVQGILLPKEELVGDYRVVWF